MSGSRSDPCLASLASRGSWGLGWRKCGLCVFVSEIDERWEPGFLVCIREGWDRETGVGDCLCLSVFCCRVFILGLHLGSAICICLTKGSNGDTSGQQKRLRGLGQSAKDDISAGGIWRWRDKADAVGDSGSSLIRSRMTVEPVRLWWWGGKFWRLFPFLHSSSVMILRWRQSEIGVIVYIKWEYSEGGWWSNYVSMIRG